MLAGDDGDRVKIYDEDGDAAWERESTRFVETRTFLKYDCKIRKTTQDGVPKHHDLIVHRVHER